MRYQKPSPDLAGGNRPPGSPRPESRSLRWWATGLAAAACLTTVGLLNFGVPRPASADILERPPYREAYARRTDPVEKPNTADDPGVYRNRAEPLYVLPAFLMKPDLTPESERPRDADNLLDAEGDLIDLAKAEPADLAFDPDPYLVDEKWREYWRKVHGMRFTHKDGPDDASMALMLRYDQVHRVSSGPTSFFPPPYQPPLDADGRLFPDVLKRIPEYRRPQYDGFAYMAFDSLEDLSASFGSGKFPAKIVPEERIIFRSVPHLIAKEYVVLPNRAVRGAVMLVKIHRVKAGVTREAFQRHWLHEHADLVLSKPATHRFVTRYAQLHNVGPDKEGELFWHPVGRTMDGVTVMEFANMNHVEDYLMSPEYAEIEADEAKHLDADRSVYWTALNHNIIDKMLNEVPTRRD